jgi:hypothetical protein
MPYLLAARAELGQGFYYSRALSIGRLESFLASRGGATILKWRIKKSIAMRVPRGLEAVHGRVVGSPQKSDQNGKPSFPPRRFGSDVMDDPSLLGIGM